MVVLNRHRSILARFSADLPSLHQLSQYTLVASRDVWFDLPIWLVLTQMEQNGYVIQNEQKTNWSLKVPDLSHFGAILA